MKKARDRSRALPDSLNGDHEFAPPVMTLTPRRFCDQQSSLDSVQIGRSLP
jgi:hypothetical protein